MNNYTKHMFRNLPVVEKTTFIECITISDNKIYSINLHAFSELCVELYLSPEIAQLIRDFIAEKIDNGTLYTPASMANYAKTKRLQLFVNSNVAEHFVKWILGGSILDGNDCLTLDSKAIIGDDGCAKADLKICNYDVEIKVTHNFETGEKIFKQAHKKPIVITYVISPDNAAHWYISIRQPDGSYSQIPEIPTNEFTEMLLNWQTALREAAKTIPLLYLKDEPNGGLSISRMFQKFS